MDGPLSAETYRAALARAHEHALSWLDSLDTRPVTPRAGIDDVAAALGTELPVDPTSPDEVIDLLARASEPGLTAMQSGRFFGFVIGGTQPAALAADWLVSAWDQNAGLRLVTPAHSAIEDITTAWLLDLLGLPPDGAVGFVTGATMANFTCLAAARQDVLRRAGWDADTDGLAGGPRIRVLVGAERHDTVDHALRLLGLGRPEAVSVDDQGRMSVSDLTAAFAEDERLEHTRPTIVVAQAGNIHSGGFDDVHEVVTVSRSHGAWVHVDGAFGLWAAASPSHRHLLIGHEGADSWATDAHKTLNTPYDTGMAIVRDPSTLRAAMALHGPYLILDSHGEPSDKTPELSRRARAVTVWAALRSLGRSGLSSLVDGLCHQASALAAGLAGIPGVTVENDVVFTQVCASFGDDDTTREVVRRVLVEGETWMSGSTWRGRAVLRISVCNWATTDGDVARSIAAVKRAVAGLGEPLSERP
ncbi:MAG TPA: pyridoxal-dependent decarboxylase [Intrasporangium sp.]|nr:pyridoxal-dependent decarboxylase [Intrasporangium sp.]